MRIETIETPELGDRSYVVIGTDAAVVIDPQRDIDRLESTLADAGAPVTHVLETHIHNDYLTGGLELARRTSATYAVNAADPVSFDRLPLHDNDVLTAGSLQIRVVATPGHTASHLAYVITADQQTAVFSGGSLLYGAVGRTDLVDPAQTDALTRAQWHSAHRLAGLPSDAALFPTHGFGSFCSSGSDSDATASTIGDEVQKSRVFRAPSEDEFVAELIESLGAYPSYYTHMAPRNLRGPSPIDLSVPVPSLQPSDIAAILAAGQTVIDLRDRVAFSARHPRGAISINLGTQLATYVGWLVPFGSPIVLIGDSPDDLDAARRQLARIGYDDVRGAAGIIDALEPLHSYPRKTFADLARRGADDVVIDVRRSDELSDGSLHDAVHVPLHELSGQLGTLPRRRLWVHCASGFRAGTAASILDNAGFDVIHVDDNLDHARDLGLVTS